MPSRAELHQLYDNGVQQKPITHKSEDWPYDGRPSPANRASALFGIAIRPPESPHTAADTNILGRFAQVRVFGTAPATATAY